MTRSSSAKAPIVFFGYNRAEHAARALESIKACPEARDSPLYVFMDGPKDEAGAPAVEAARAAVRSAAPGHATIVCRDANLGLANSVRAGVSEVCEAHGRVIVIEDDLILSPAALTYFNAALDRYENDPRVMHVAGYWPATKEALPPAFFVRWPSVWGWATWTRAWDHFEWDAELLAERIRAEWMIDRFDESAWPFYANLLGTIEGEYDSWGIRWYASVLLARGLALHPARALVANAGNDGSGVHMDVAGFDVELADDVPELPDEISELDLAVRALADFNRRALGPPRRRGPVGRRLLSRLKGGLQRMAPDSLPRRLVSRIGRAARPRPRVAGLVTGAPRSGTTAVADWLAAQPGVCGTAESRVLMAAHGLLREVDRFRTLQAHRWDWEAEDRELVLEAYSRQGLRFAGQVLLEKEPLEPIALPDLDYEDFLRHARTALTGLKIIYMVRDPVATMWSMTQREWGFSRTDLTPQPLDFDAHLQNWIDCARLALKVRNSPSVRICRYEDLITEPEAESRRIADFLELEGWGPFEPRKPSTVGFDDDARERILEATRELRGELGY